MISREDKHLDQEEVLILHEYGVRRSVSDWYGGIDDSGQFSLSYVTKVTLLYSHATHIIHDD